MTQLIAPSASGLALLSSQNPSTQDDIWLADCDLSVYNRYKIVANLDIFRTTIANVVGVEFYFRELPSTDRVSGTATQSTFNNITTSEDDDNRVPVQSCHAYADTDDEIYNVFEFDLIRVPNKDNVMAGFFHGVLSKVNATPFGAFMRGSFFLRDVDTIDNIRIITQVGTIEFRTSSQLDIYGGNI